MSARPRARAALRPLGGRSFRVRLSLSVAGLLFVALMALCGLSGVMLWRASTRDLDDTLREQLAVVSRAAREPGGSPLPGSLLSVLSAGSDVVDARIERRGAVVWDSGFRRMPETGQSGLSQLQGWRLLREGGRDLAVQVGRPITATRETLTAYARASVPLALLMSLLGGALAWWLVGRGLRPLSRLARRVERLDADEPIPSLDRQDEVGALARALASSLSALRERRAAERAFVARASHELRTPVAALQAELEFALSKPRPAEDYRSALQGARRQAQHLERLAVNLLTLTRLEGLPPQLAPLDLWEVVADAVDRFQPLALRKDLTLDLSGEPTLVRGDRILLARLLDNLLQNAIRYTECGGVTVQVEPAAVIIEDTGVGFPVERLAEPTGLQPPGLFEESGQQGFGMGLSVIRAIAQAHGAQLQIERLLQGGSRVAVCFPTLQEATFQEDREVKRIKAPTNAPGQASP